MFMTIEKYYFKHYSQNPLLGCTEEMNFNDTFYSFIIIILPELEVKAKMFFLCSTIIHILAQYR